jgi:hypothetical protein
VRTLLWGPAILGFSWWLALELLERPMLLEVAAFHEEAAARYQRIADSPIPDRALCFGRGLDGICRPIVAELSRAEIEHEERLRNQAARRAMYHLALKREYTWASWLPCVPLAPDPPEPE